MMRTALTGATLMLAIGVSTSTQDADPEIVRHLQSIKAIDNHAHVMAAIPLSTVIGAPISGLLLGMDGLMGMKGWQWLFIIEAIPALLMSVAVLFYLTDRPAEATWLEPDERAWLTARLQLERTKRETVRHYSVAQALLNPKVLALSLVYFGAVSTNYGLSFFLPQIVKAFGVSNLQAGFITALPYVVGVVSIVWWGRHSDRTLERRYHLAFPLFVASACIAISTMRGARRRRCQVGLSDHRLCRRRDHRW